MYNSVHFHFYVSRMQTQRATRRCVQSRMRFERLGDERSQSRLSFSPNRVLFLFAVPISYLETNLRGIVSMKGETLNSRLESLYSPGIAGRTETGDVLRRWLTMIYVPS